MQIFNSYKLLDGVGSEGVLFVSFVLGLYSLSTVLLFRLNLPLQYRFVVCSLYLSHSLTLTLTDIVLFFFSYVFYFDMMDRYIIDAVLGEIEFVFYHRWSDVLSVVTIAITFSVILLTKRPRVRFS